MHTITKHIATHFLHYSTLVREEHFGSGLHCCFRARQSWVKRFLLPYQFKYNFQCFEQLRWMNFTLLHCIWLRAQMIISNPGQIKLKSGVESWWQQAKQGSQVMETHCVLKALLLHQKMVGCSFWLRSQPLPQAMELKYLGILFTSEVKMEHRIGR